MRILLTGASGMVGRNILKLDNVRDHEFLTPNSRELDLLEPLKIRAYLEQHSPELIIHAAGTVGGIQANMAQPVKFLVDNMLMGMNIISSSYTVGVKNLINLGSSCMYPKNAPNPLKESYVLSGALEPTNEGYALAKISSAKLCQYISEEDSGKNYKTIIPCNLYGFFDKFDITKAHMIPAVIQRIHEAKIKNTESIKIWGDGFARREFMFAADLADFIFFCIERISSMPSVINVGLGKDYSINEYYQAIAKIVDYEGAFKHDLSKPVGMRQKLIDDTLLTKFGWRHKTPLDIGLGMAYQYYLNEYNK